MKLDDLLESLEPVEVTGSTDIDIADIAYDSRKVKKGSLFVCIEGTKQDGHTFVSDAIINGASAVLATKSVDIPGDVTFIKVINARKDLAIVSDVFFGHPSGKLELIGITGTKGKTTITYLIKSILEAAGRKVGLIGTIKNMIGSEVLYAERTTPESYDLQSLLALMADKGADTTVMEVSSQGLALHRVDCCEFDIGIFTNLSRDHIGPKEHASMQDYFAAKLKLFEISRIGLVNIDSDYGSKVMGSSDIHMYKYGINNEADIYATDIKRFPDSMSFLAKTPWWDGMLTVSIPGTFSVYNALAAIGAAGICGIPYEIVREGLAGVRVSGRAETVDTSGLEMAVIVDYAHTPDSLENILATMKENTKGRLVCVFGCGGDRDRAKRPIMGEISGKLADFTIITSDNPRTEDPEDIVHHIQEGIMQVNGLHSVIVDRREAIRSALLNALPGDTIVIAGKGHENYQQFADRTIHFDDKEVAREIIDEIRKRS